MSGPFSQFERFKNGKWLEWIDLNEPFKALTWTLYIYCRLADKTSYLQLVTSCRYEVLSARDRYNIIESIYRFVYPMKLLLINKTTNQILNGEIRSFERKILLIDLIAAGKTLKPFKWLNALWMPREWINMGTDWNGSEMSVYFTRFLTVTPQDERTDEQGQLHMIFRFGRMTGA